MKAIKRVSRRPKQSPDYHFSANFPRSGKTSHRNKFAGGEIETIFVISQDTNIQAKNVYE